jgi:hypothetical protein
MTRITVEIDANEAITHVSREWTNPGDGSLFPRRSTVETLVAAAHFVLIQEEHEELEAYEESNS